MKTAISLPDPLFDEAEKFAKQKGLSRSELYAKALALYLKAHRRREITESLNEIYDKEISTVDPALMAAQLKSLRKENW